MLRFKYLIFPWNGDGRFSFFTLMISDRRQHPFKARCEAGTSHYPDRAEWPSLMRGKMLEIRVCALWRGALCHLAPGNCGWPPSLHLTFEILYNKVYFHTAPNLLFSEFRGSFSQCLNKRSPQLTSFHFASLYMRRQGGLGLTLQSLSEVPTLVPECVLWALPLPQR